MKIMLEKKYFLLNIEARNYFSSCTFFLRIQLTSISILHCIRIGYNNWKWLGFSISIFQLVFTVELLFDYCRNFKIFFIKKEFIDYKL